MNGRRHTVDFWCPARQRTLASVTLAVAAFVLIGEIVARVAGFGDPPLVVLDDKIEYYLLPAREYHRFGKLYRINSRSMRSDEIPDDTRMPASTYAILGDSVVYGAGLDQSATIAQQLRKLLVGPSQGTEADADGPLVLSIAASSWGPENLLAFYDRFGPIPGNTAWIIQSTHDMTDVINQPGDPVPYRTSPPYGALHDALLASARWAAPRMSSAEPEMVNRGDQRARADAALATLITRLRADYKRVVLIFHATRSETLLRDSGGEPHFRNFATKAGIDFISTRETYLNAYISGTALHYDDIHPNENGAVFLAQLLYSSHLK